MFYEKLQYQHQLTSVVKNGAGRE